MPTKMTEELSHNSSPANTPRHVLKVQDNLWADALELAAVVESARSLSVTALCHHRPELATKVKENERDINRREVAIESECLRVLALYGPVGLDFRRVLAVLRVNRDLERIGDLAARVAKRAKKLARGLNPHPIPEPLEALGESALLSVRGALDSLIRCDARAGRSVIAEEHRLAQSRRKVRAGLKKASRQDMDRVEEWLRLMDVARHFERVGDHAASIAEAVVYMKEGELQCRSSNGPIE